MRKLLVSAAILTAGLLSLSSASQAGERRDWVCWMTPAGVTDCGWLNRHYHVHKVMKPHRHERGDCNHCAVNFKLSHRKIHDLGHAGVDTETMRNYHDATLYGDRVRKHHHH